MKGTERVGSNRCRWILCRIVVVGVRQKHVNHRVAAAADVQVILPCEEMRNGRR